MTGRIYLVSSYAERQRVKALGAQFDAERKAWFVPPGYSLEPFRAWLPQGTVAEPASTDVAVVRGVSLSELMGRASQAVANAFRNSEWVRVEVVNVQARNHVYLELAERDATGQVRAQVRGVIWAATARVILARFEKATGMVLGPDIKLLVSAKPVLHPQYGLSLQIEDIDPQYTLGDLEARRREIRERLQREGLFELNRRLPAPWDFREVVVLAPEQAAGLGDFMAEARRLEQFAICRFVIVHSRFQGEGAAAEMRHALLSALLASSQAGDVLPDAVVIIRGGGAVSDLAWLDDYALARCLCEMEMPVFTGIGHERDNTILDEVAHTRFDTPSKVIAGIEQTIVARVREAAQAFDAIHARAAHSAAQWRGAIRQADAQVREGALRQIDRARTTTRDLHDGVHHAARRAVAEARGGVDDRIGAIRQQARAQLETARRQTPLWMAEVASEARQSLRSARQLAAGVVTTVLDRTRMDIERERDKVHEAMRAVAHESNAAVADARQRSESLMREIVGQGPEKTLRRGFAVVRDAEGRALMSAKALRDARQASVEFQDGSVPTEVRGKPGAS
jgi:exodeoxyribonuclease VII large subunit